MKKNILIGVSASIAAYKACELVSLFKKEDFSVKCMMTKGAKEFITPLTLETLTENKVSSVMFSLPENRSPEHISLATNADIILIAPATADIISKVAGGICDDIITCTICASTKPVVFAPAMNNSMYNNPIIQEKIQYLKDKNYYFIDPIEGNLACGSKGIGHLAPVSNIVEKVKKILVS